MAAFPLHICHTQTVIFTCHGYFMETKQIPVLPESVCRPSMMSPEQPGCVVHAEKENQNSSSLFALVLLPQGSTAENQSLSKPCWRLECNYHCLQCWKASKSSSIFGNNGLWISLDWRLMHSLLHPCHLMQSSLSPGTCVFATVSTPELQEQAALAWHRLQRHLQYV